MPSTNSAITRATEADLAAMQNCSPTQPTQGTLDPRRGGDSTSESDDVDMSDIICILHPCSPAAFDIVVNTAVTNPQHVLQDVSGSHYTDNLSQADLDEVETFNLHDASRPQPLDLALRFSSTRKKTASGFVFGRSPTFCDIVISPDTIKRHSNTHFRIFLNQNGVCMLEDISTNGTVVDKVLLKGKHRPQSATRMLNSGSIIELVSPRADEIVKFIVRIPSRQSHHEQFATKFILYMEQVRLAELRQRTQDLARTGDAKATHSRAAAAGNLPLVRPPMDQNTWGMRWNGGDKYNVVGHLGKGAFATVYQLATKDHGQWYAAKELEKRRFMKNGILDRKLDNELQIMKAIDHPHIVRYIDYHESDMHLYIIMEYVPCGDLQQLLHASGPLPEQLAKVIAKQVLTALAYLHKKKITHRDIKPDNILIADNSSVENFSVKLSDFGLSKVVTDNSTFLKTFCGTLLYCAPEVFPHWDNYLAANGKRGNKRKNRRATTPQRPKYHMYSPSVDIWSLGGVLWYAMCLKPPFEGVADATGRGMFDRIMTTSLEPGPLIESGIPVTAIDLLEEMLDTDPAERPTPEKCLLHNWFADRTRSADSQMSDYDDELEDDGLGTIQEEGESDEDDAPDFSQLSLVDGELSARKPLQETSLNSSDYDDLRRSKRFKFDANLLGKAASQPRGPSEHGFSDASPATRPAATQATEPRVLFGEVEPSFLQSSGVFGARGHAFPPREEAPSNHSSIYVASTTGHEDLFASAASRIEQEDDGESRDDRSVHLSENDRHPGLSSLGGVEPDMRELNMESPSNSADSPPPDSNEPQTPKTPEMATLASPNPINASVEDTPKAEEATPRKKKFSRRIDIPITASFFYDPNDPSTHNAAYASAVSGYDFTSCPVMPLATFDSLPPIIHASKTARESTKPGEESIPQQAGGSEFARPAPRLGRLTSTASSFADITMDLSARVTSWGRATGNTFVYPDCEDTRVPKVGIVIYFHAAGIEEAEKAGTDWTKLPGLHCLLWTESKVGIRVNGVKLMARDKDGRRLFGRVHTGDVVTICSGTSTLEFECLFNHGEGRERRSETGARFQINTEMKRGATGA